MLDEVAHGLAESGGGDENALGGVEAVHIRTTDGIAGGVALGLNIDGVEAWAIFVRDAGDTAVTGAVKLSSGILVAAAIAHGNQEIDVNHHRDWSALIDSMNVYNAA